MNYLDISLVIPMVYGLIRGFSKGIVKEITSLAAIVIGIYLALSFSVHIEHIFIRITSIFSSELSKKENESFIPIISFAVIFLLSVISVKAIGNIINRITNILALGVISKILGALFSFVKVCLLLSALIYFEKTIEIIPKKIIKISVIYSPLESVIEKLLPSIKKHKGIIKEFENEANKAKSNTEKNNKIK